MLEVVWKVYIDFEEEEGEYERICELYECFFVKVDYFKVWISYVQFEINILEVDEGGEEDEDEDCLVSEEVKERVCKIFECVYKSMKEREFKVEWVLLFNVWLVFEKMYGLLEDVEKVNKQMLRKMKKKRKLEDDMWEEYVDYIFFVDD